MKPKRTRRPNPDNDIIIFKDLLWVPLGKGYSLTDDNGAEIIIACSSSNYTCTLLCGKEPAPLVIEPSTLKECLKVGSDYAHRYLSINSVNINAEWMQRNQPATNEQQEYLEAHHVHRNLNRFDANIEIMKIKALSRVSSRNLAFAIKARFTSCHRAEKHPSTN